MSADVKTEESVKSAEGVVARPSMKERQRQLREDAILDATLDLLKTKGYDSMTLEDITEAIGISRPTLYLHFKSKEDIVLHISLRCRTQLLDFIQSQDKSRRACDRLIDFCNFALDIRFSEQGMAFGDLVKVVSSFENEQPLLGQCEVQLMDEYVGLAAEAQAEGTVRADMSPVMMSQVIVGFIKNYTLDGLIADGRITIDEIKESAKKLLLV